MLQEGYWELTTNLGSFLNLDVDLFANVFLKNKGILSLGEKSQNLRLRAIPGDSLGSNSNSSKTADPKCPVEASTVPLHISCAGGPLFYGSILSIYHRLNSVDNNIGADNSSNHRHTHTHSNFISVSPNASFASLQMLKCYFICVSLHHLCCERPLIAPPTLHLLGHCRNIREQARCLGIEAENKTSTM